MDFNRLIAVVIVAAIPASFVLSQHDAKTRVNDTNANLVAGCKSNSARTALNAAGWRIAAAVRADAGDALVAKRYNAIADGIAAQIPDAPGATGDIAEVTLAERPHVSAEYSLTPRAKALQAAGCESLYR